MAEDGWFDPGIVHRRWQDHLSGRRSSPQALWAILMFQSWLRQEKSSGCGRCLSQEACGFLLCLGAPIRAPWRGPGAAGAIRPHPCQHRSG